MLCYAVLCCAMRCYAQVLEGAKARRELLAARTSLPVYAAMAAALEQLMARGELATQATQAAGGGGGASNASHVSNGTLLARLCLTPGLCLKLPAFCQRQCVARGLGVNDDAASAPRRPGARPLRPRVRAAGNK